jgi:sarcosine oxidase
LHADRLILAPGAWAPELVRLGVPMRVERRVQHYWRPTDPAAFERLPVWIWGSGERTGYGLPAVESGRVKAALHWGTGGEAVDPDTAMAPARPDEVAEIRDWVTGRLPGLGDWMGAKPCLYTLTPDEHFVLGKHPAHPNVAVACGFSGHGFKFVPVIGEILADLVQDRPVGYDLSLFDPSRFGAHTIPA